MPPATSSQQGLLLRRLGDAIKARRTGRARSGGWRGCLHDFPLPSLRRCSQIAVRFILANLQRAEHAVEVSRFGRVAIGAAEARMNHPDMASAPLRAAFFDRPEIARADRKLHCAEIARLAEVTPVVAFPRHLVHVGKVLAQIAVAGFDKAGAMLKTDTTDKSRVEG